MLVRWIMDQFPETITTPRQAQLILALIGLFTFSSIGSLWWGVRPRIHRPPPPPMPSRQSPPVKAPSAHVESDTKTFAPPPPLLPPTKNPEYLKPSPVEHAPDQTSKDDEAISALELIGYINDPKVGVTAEFRDMANNRYWVRGSRVTGPFGDMPRIHVHVRDGDLLLTNVNNKELAEFSLQ